MIETLAFQAVLVSAVLGLGWLTVRALIED